MGRSIPNLFIFYFSARRTVATFYDILGVSKQADANTIRHAFRSLAVKYHPDKNPGNQHAEEVFKKINAAYQVLSNPDSRAAYDLSLENPFRAYTSKSNAQKRYEERKRSGEYQRQYQYRRRAGGPMDGSYSAGRSRKNPEPPIKPWKAYALIAVLVGVFSIGLLGLMRALEIYEARQKYESALHIWKVSSRPDLAQKHLNTALSRDDEYQEAYALYADLGIELGKAEEALFHAQQAFKLSEDPTAEDRFRLARCLIASGRKEEAYYHLRQGLALQPFNPWALYAIADLELYHYRKYEEAIVYFNRYLSVKPYQKDAMLHKAVAHQQLSAYDSAGHYLEAVLEMKPQDAVARFYYGKNLVHERDTAKACPMFEYAFMKGVRQAEWYIFQYCQSPSDSLAGGESLVRGDAP